MSSSTTTTDGDRAAAGGDRITCGTGRDRIKARELRRVDRLARDCELFTTVEHRTDELVADDDAVTAQLRDLRRSGTAVVVTVKCVRPEDSAACVIGARLRMPGSNRALAQTLASVTVKPGGQTTLRLRLSAAGQRRVRRGRQVRLLVAERTREGGSFLLYRAEAQAQVTMRWRSASDPPKAPRASRRLLRSLRQRVRVSSSARSCVGQAPVCF